MRRADVRAIAREHFRPLRSAQNLYDGSREQDNPLSEQTAIHVPLVMIDLSFRDDVRGLGDTNVSAWFHGGSPLRVHWKSTSVCSYQQAKTRAPKFRTELVEGSRAPCHASNAEADARSDRGLSVERRLYGGRWINSLAARVPVAENTDGLRVEASSELGTGWAHELRTHRLMPYGRFQRSDRVASMEITNWFL
jgi:hypothetical protein